MPSNDTRLSLLGAATPAIVGSIVLMHYAGVGRQPVLQQLAVFGAGCAALALAPRQRQRVSTHARSNRASMALAAALFLPFVAGADAGPHRWVSLGGVRLYLAPVVLPVLLLLLSRSATVSPRSAAVAAGTTITAALALAFQPDAAQTGALACAAVPMLWVSRLSRTSRAVVLAALIGCAAIAWQRPDSLAPVAHVEGVFALAGRGGPAALAAAICAAIAPPAVLLWQSWRAGPPGLFAVAVYYGVILTQSPLQITPVPLLGFGAGPIAGYFLMAMVAAGEPPNRDTQCA